MKTDIDPFEYRDLARKKYENRVELERLRIAKDLGAFLDGSNNKEIILEIGCGHGHYLTAYAAANPDKVCVGIDLLGGRLGRAQHKCTRLGLKNALFLKGDIYDLLAVWPTKDLISGLFILFPDPWPKRRHHKNRIIQTTFLGLLAQNVKLDGRLFFRSDSLDYVEWTKSHLIASSQWELESSVLWPFELKTIFQERADLYYSLVAKKK